MKKYNFLVIGYGSIGKKHYLCLKEIFPQSNIKVLSSKKINNNDFITDLSDAILFKPDIAIICNPANLHISTAIHFASIGSNILIEKPLDISLDYVKKLQKISKKNNVQIQIGYNLRFLKSLQFFKKIIITKKYGTPLLFNSQVGQRLDQWRDSDTPLNRSISLNKENGGGVIYELSHEIDYLQWIFGDLLCIGSSFSDLFYKNSNVEDCAIINFQRKSRNKKDLIGVLMLDMIRLKPVRFCEVVTDEGFIRWDGIDQKVEINHKLKNKIISFSNDSIKFSYIRQFLSFVNAINNNKPITCDLSEGIKVLKLIHKIKERQS